MSKKRRPRPGGRPRPQGASAPGPGGPRGVTRSRAPGSSGAVGAGTSATQRKPSGRAVRVAARARKDRRRRFRNVSVVALSTAVLGGVIALAVSAGSSAAGDSTNPKAFVLPRLGAQGKVRLASYRGTPVVVNFFASWCTQCAAELPVFANDARGLRGKVDFVEVNALETGNGLAFAKRYGIPSSVTAVASDVGGSQGDGLYQALGGTGSMPMTAFYSASGKLLTTHVGAFGSSTLAAELSQLYGVHAA
jgi:thiol-disulfide isomerase/thioredoxin